MNAAFAKTGVRVRWRIASMSGYETDAAGNQLYDCGTILAVVPDYGFDAYPAMLAGKPDTSGTAQVLNEVGNIVRVAVSELERIR